MLKDYLFEVMESSDGQLAEMLAMFRNDFKPPMKNLWVEKNPLAESQKEAGEPSPAHLIDILEDRMIVGNNFSGIWAEKDQNWHFIEKSKVPKKNIAE
jgi:hypothetical protein